MTHARMIVGPVRIRPSSVRITRDGVLRLDNQFMGNMWAGQRISGIDFAYDDAQPDDYNSLFPLVVKYRHKLIVDKVLEPKS